jgi:hypothetical protein
MAQFFARRVRKSIYFERITMVGCLFNAGTH